MYYDVLVNTQRFQSTRLREARFKTRPNAGIRFKRFNPRACGRRDSNQALGCYTKLCFNPRACGRRDFLLFQSSILMAMFQSTRLREARFNSNNRGASRTIVSIHAPAGGAIPTGLASITRNSGFNPRACGRRD